jgi:hypothetical protein
MCANLRRLLPLGLVLLMCAAPAPAFAQDDGDDLDWGVGFLVDADIAQAFLADGDKLCREAEEELAVLGAVTTCESETTVDAWSIDGGITVGRFIAAKVGYLDIGRASFDLAGSSGSLAGTAAGHFGRARGATFTLIGRFDIGWFVPYAEGGMWRWTAPTGASASINTTPPFAFSDSADIDSWDPIWGGGAEFWFHRHFGISAGFRNIRLKTDDTVSLTGASMDETFRLIFVGLKIGNR